MIKLNTAVEAGAERFNNAGLQNGLGAVQCDLNRGKARDPHDQKNNGNP